MVDEMRQALYAALGIVAGVIAFQVPMRVWQQAAPYLFLLGVGVLVGLFQFGSLPHALAQKNIRLFGEKVLPALKRG